MPDPDGYPTDEETDARLKVWEEAPSIEDFPQEETDRIKADPTTLGWTESPFGEVYLGSDYKFFSPTQPQYADMLNSFFMGGPLQYSPACGQKKRYYLQNAARWSKCGYRVKPSDGDSLVPGVVY